MISFLQFFTGALAYYSEYNDVFNSDKTREGEIFLANIVTIESSTDKDENNCAAMFRIQAKVVKGGDSDGMKTFTFDAKTALNAEKWMAELCAATEIYELEKNSLGKFHSVLNEPMVQRRNSRRHSFDSKSSMSRISFDTKSFENRSNDDVQVMNDSTLTLNTPSYDFNDSDSLEGSPANSSNPPSLPSNPTAYLKKANGSPRAVGGGPGARSGKGRGANFRAHSSNALISTKSVDQPSQSEQLTPRGSGIDHIPSPMKGTPNDKNTSVAFGDIYSAGTTSM